MSLVFEDGRALSYSAQTNFCFCHFLQCDDEPKSGFADKYRKMKVVGQVGSWMSCAIVKAGVGRKARKVLVGFFGESPLKG